MIWKKTTEWSYWILHQKSKYLMHAVSEIP